MKTPSLVLTRLTNCANNCYINSCLQLLTHTPELQNSLLKFPKNAFEDSLLLKNWIELNGLISNNSCQITPGKFLNIIYNKYGHLFDYGTQHDMCEFFIFMVDNIIESTIILNPQSAVYNTLIPYISNTGNVMKNTINKICNKFVNKIIDHYSPIMNLFYNINATIIIDEKSGVLLNTIPALENVINLPISLINRQGASVITLDECLTEYTSFENMNKKNNNAWYNDTTKQYIDVRKKTLFWFLPAILSIRLNRFTNAGIKDNTLVDIPFTLNMSPYIISDERYQYELYAICHHVGTLQGGHYFIYIKAIDDNWYRFDDNKM